MNANEAKETIRRFLWHIENSQTASIEGINNYYIPQISKKSLWKAKRAFAALEPKCQPKPKPKPSSSYHTRARRVARGAVRHGR